MQIGNSGRKRRNAPGPPNDQQRKDLAENLLRVDVYFETLSVQSITEDPTYNVSIEWLKKEINMTKENHRLSDLNSTL